MLISGGNRDIETNPIPQKHTQTQILFFGDSKSAVTRTVINASIRPNNSYLYTHTRYTYRNQFIIRLLAQSD